MEAIIIEVEKASDVKFWLNLAKKTGAKAKSINTEQMVDAKLGELIESGLKTKTVSRNSVLKALATKE
jgi:hypothetical protein